MQLNHNSKDQLHQHWLIAYSIRFSTVSIIALCWIGLFTLFNYFEYDKFLKIKIEDPVNFQVRELIGASPYIDPRLKIYAYDDPAFSIYGDPNSDNDMWAAVLSTLAKAKPKLIVFDGMFGSAKSKFTEYGQKSLQDVVAQNINVVIGSYLVEKEFPFRDQMNLKSDIYNFDRYISEDVPSSERLNRSELKNVEHLIAYGPAKKYQNYFKNVGHFQIFEEHQFKPFIFLGENRVLPHVSMFAADSITLASSRMMIDGKNLILDANAASPINFISRNRLDVKSMAPLIRKSLAGETSSYVKEGDVVLVLPLFFTGHTDFRPTPFGWMPGGLFLAATLNSVLTGQWLQPIMAEYVLLTLATCLSTFAAFYLSTIGFWIFGTASAVSFFILIQIAFSYFGLEIPFLVPLIAAGISGVHVFILKVISAERKTFALRAALEGAVSPNQLEQIIQKPELVNLEPRERIVTLMFIDIVGFSLSSENMLPRSAFDNLKNLLGTLSDIIHKNNGIVDKTLGDGLLCYFGYRFDNDSTESDHPERALRCAIEIQKLLLDEGLKAARLGKPIYPLRIGINTSSCYLGDLGSGARIEFTVVGNGVNFAKRLEAACDMYNIMIGPTTFDMIKGLDIGTNHLSRKMIKIKHHNNLIDAYEVNPFVDNALERAEVVDAYRKNANLQRTNDRLNVKDGNRITVMTPHGIGKIVNFSETGISFVLKTPISRGSLIEFSFVSKIGSFASDYGGLLIPLVNGEVRWSYTTAEGVAHGIMYRGLTEEQQRLLLRLLTEYSFMEIVEAESENSSDADTKAG